MKKINVVVLLGGSSKERVISLKSGYCVIHSLYCLKNVNVFSLDPKYKSLNYLLDKIYYKVFILLHGLKGEDGSIQGFLDCYGIPYVGGGVFTSSLSIDKFKTKIFLSSFGVKVIPSVLINIRNYHQYFVRKQIKEKFLKFLSLNIGYPLLLKPTKEGSSIGILFVKNEEYLKYYLVKYFFLYKNIIIEKYILGLEYSVGIICDKLVLPPIQIKKNNLVFDFHLKYSSKFNSYYFNTLSSKLNDILSRISLNIWDILECKDLLRIDFILDNEDNFWFLEVNTIPGMTHNSLIPRCAKKLGINFDDLIKMILFNSHV